MLQRQPKSSKVCFNGFELDLKTAILYRGEERIPIQELSFQVLTLLLERPGELVTREELHRRVWGSDTFVEFEDSLNHAISKLRETLGDSATHPQFVETLPRRGYRFIAPVERISKGPRLKSWRFAAIALALGASAVLILLIGLMLALDSYRSTPSVANDTPIDSIAVLPFLSGSEDEDSVSLAAGIPASIGSSLSRLANLRVKSSSLLRRYQGKEVDPQTVSMEQDVKGVLTGRVERRGDFLTVTVELMDGRDSTLIWSQRYAREFRDVFEVEEDIARQVAGGLRLQLTDQQNLSLAQTGTNDPEAYQAYLRGQFYRNRSLTAGHDHREDRKKAISHFEEAIREDPNYQQAYDALAWVHFNRAYNLTNADEDYTRALECWERVVQIDDSTVWGHIARGEILFRYQREWEQAEVEYRRAEELQPGREIESFLDWMGRREERMVFEERRLRLADPLSASQQLLAGWAFLSLREFDRAIEQAEKTLSLEPHSRNANWVLRHSYDHKGMGAKAFEAALKTDIVSGIDQEELATLRGAFERSGLEALWRWDLDYLLRKQNPKLIRVATLFAKLGDTDRAFEWLEKAWSKPLFGWGAAPSSSFWDPLRDDPRFEGLMRELNLPEEAIQRHLALPSG